MKSLMPSLKLGTKFKLKGLPKLHLPKLKILPRKK